ncbi:helix-turn-helix transcriptional regulator [Amycolatopsis pigmentata]|uniref:Helix-turn-helix transcriptional regulator n=1 Tax=Amycolatopsis pigmentata TaxID=450801 RepID=A0ABW5FM95_9PSEU
MSARKVVGEPSAALGESRARVLGLLRAAGRSLGVKDVAERSGLHPNTARFHLDGLVERGFAERETEDRSRPGRPRMVYRALTGTTTAGRRSYRLLAEMLTGLVTEAVPDPQQAAVAAGEAWGRFLVERPPRDRHVDAEEALRRLSAVLAEAGFAPGPVSDPATPVIPLLHCPFREVAQQHREVVCSLHLGVIRGVLEEVRAPLAVTGLDPFVDSARCLAYLEQVQPTP